jgi:hypothetical protein
MSFIYTTPKEQSHPEKTINNRNIPKKITIKEEQESDSKNDVFTSSKRNQAVEGLFTRASGIRSRIVHALNIFN